MQEHFQRVLNYVGQRPWFEVQQSGAMDSLLEIGKELGFVQVATEKDGEVCEDCSED